MKRIPVVPMGVIETLLHVKFVGTGENSENAKWLNIKGLFEYEKNTYTRISSFQRVGILVLWVTFRGRTFLGERQEL